MIANNRENTRIGCLSWDNCIEVVYHEVVPASIHLGSLYTYELCVAICAVIMLLDTLEFIPYTSVSNEVRVVFVNLFLDSSMASKLGTDAIWERSKQMLPASVLHTMLHLKAV